MGDRRTFKEDVLSGLHFEPGFLHLYLDDVRRMFDDFGDGDLEEATDESDRPFYDVESDRPDTPFPALRWRRDTS